MSSTPKKKINRHHHQSERLGDIEAKISHRVAVMRDRLSRRVDIWNGETPLNPHVVKELDQSEKHGVIVREFKRNRK